MKEYIVIVILMVGFCFAQTFDDLTEEQKLIYNRNKLSIEVVKKTEGGAVGSSYGNIAAGSYSAESWNKWMAYKGLGIKIPEYEFFYITGYKNEAKDIKEKYLKSKQRLVGSLKMGGAGCSLFLVGGILEDFTNMSGSSVILSLVLGGTALGTYGFIKYLTVLPTLKYNSVPYSAVEPIMEEYNKNLIKDIINNKF